MSKNVQKTIEINAKVKTSLEGLDKTIRQLEEGLASQKLNLGKNSGLSKLIKDYKDSKEQLDELLSGDSIARTDIKKVEQLGTKVSTLYKQIGKSFRELQNGNEEVFKKIFPSSFTAQITKSTQAINTFLSKLDTLGTKETRVGELRRELDVLNDELDSLKNRRIKIEVEADKKKVEQALAQIDSEMQKMRSSFKQKLFPEEVKDSKGKTQTEKLESSFQTWTQKLQQDKEAKKNLRVQELSKTQEKQIAKLQGQLTDSYGDDLIKSENERLKALLAEQKKRAIIAKTPGAKDTARNRREYGGVTDKELAAQIAKSEKEILRLETIVQQINDIKQQPQKAYEAAVKKLDTQIKTDETKLKNAEDKLKAHSEKRAKEESVAEQKANDFISGKQVAEATQQEIEALQKLNDEKAKSLELDKKLREEKTFESQEAKEASIKRKGISIDKKQTDIQSLQNEINKLVEETNIDDFFDKLKEFGINTEGIERNRQGLEEIRKELKNLNAEKVTQIRQALVNMGYSADAAEDLINSLTDGIEKLGETDQDLKRTESEIESLKGQILDFFSITNTVQIFKNAIRDAYDTVKELDAAMTETAVVTDFSIGDMWEQLPRYTEAANKLGTTTLGAYETMTLFYQQGLKTNEVFEIGTEVMKMARIAGLDYSDATNKMTAALRGFNMELNETSAQRVNDVYSELAAITAADTEEIANAMTKTASIAHSANMEFETTAAFLSQIIETTRESAETAGTAMKTVVARFQELKKDPSEIGEVDGEIVDANKIETALRTVGVELRDSTGQFRELDNVFLELASKWDSLDTNTQRYIATIAAGSRQQSRFIAMMSDYDRTMQLVNAANTSAGASQRQFEKTIDSLESKLNKLSNAWDQFVMGLANNEIIKFGVELVTDLITGVNNLTDSLPGVLNTFTKLGIVIGGLKVGGAVFNSLLASIGDTLINGTKKIGQQAGAKMGESLINETAKQAKSGKNVNEIFKSYQILSMKVQSKLKPITFKFKPEKEEGFVESLVELENIDTQLKQSGLTLEKYNELQKARIDIQEKLSSAYVLEGKAVENLSVNQKNVLAQALAEKTISEQQLALMGPKTAAKYADAVASGDQATAIKLKNQAETAEQNLQAGGITGLLTEIGLRFTGRAATEMHKDSIWELVAAKWAEFTAWVATNSVMLIGLGVVLAIVAAVAALTVAISWLIKMAKDSSPEAKLEAAQKAAEQAGEAADKAAESFTNLKTSLDGLQDKYNGLEELTRGTNDWREAVQDINREVLNLIEQYPELAKFVDSTSKPGVLKIDLQSQDVQDVLTKASNNAMLAASMEAAANIAVQEAQKNKSWSDLNSSNKIYQEDINNGVVTNTWVNEEITKELAQALAKGDITTEISDIKKWLQNQFPNRQFTFAQSFDPKALRRLGEDILVADSAIQALTDSILNNAIANIDAEKYTKEQLEQTNGFISSERLETTYSEALETYDNLTYEAQEELKQEYADIMGYEYSDGQFYADKAAKESGTALNISDKELKQQIVMSKVTKSATLALESFIEALDKVSNDSLTALFNEREGAALTQEDIAKLYEDGVLNTQVTTELWNQLSPKAQAFYGSDIKNFEQEIIKALEIAGERFRTSMEDLSRYGVNADFYKGLSSGAVQGLADNMHKVFMSSGFAGTKEVNDIITSMMPKDSEQAEKFAGALNGINWTNIDDVKSLSENLKSFDIVVNQGTYTIEDLEKAIIDCAKATKDWDLNKLKEELKSIGKLADDIADRKATERTFTEEQLKQILKASPMLESQFIMTGIDEFTYIGDSMTDLELALRSLESTILEQRNQQIQDNAEKSSRWQEVMGSDRAFENQLYDPTQDVYVSGFDSYKDAIEKIISGDSRANLIIDSLLQELGISTDGDTEAKVARLKENYDKYYGVNGTIAEQNILAANQGTTTEQQLLQLRYSSTGSGFGVINAGANTEEEIRAQSAALEVMIKSEAGLEYTVENTKKALEEQYEEFAKNERLVKALAIDNYKVEKSIKSLCEVVEDNNDALSAGNKALVEGKAPSNAYYTALSEIKNAARGVFGKAITDEFMQKDGMSKLFEQLVEGGEVGKTAFEKIQDAVRESTLETVKDNELLKDELTEIETWITNADLSFSIEGYADVTDIVNKLLQVGYAAEEAKAIVEGLTGATVEFEIEYQTTTIPTAMWEATKNTSYKGWSAVNDNGQMTTIQIPKSIGAKGAIATKNNYNDSGFRSKSSGSSSKDDTWENPYDKFYNTYERINTLLREREKIERRYQKLISREEASGKNLIDNAKQQLSLLRQRASEQEFLKEGKLQEIRDLRASNVKYDKYVTNYDEQAGTISIDWDAINKIKNTDTGEAVEKYISKLEELRDQWRESQDALDEIEDTVEEIQERGKDEYFDIEERIKDALIKERQDEIDMLSEINDSINDTNSKLLESMQEQLNEYRQNRDNEKTEKELSDKQRKLAYLQQDTTGANALEILKLQKELDEATEDYTDTLIDQKISELQHQNDIAAEQRQTQIDIMQAQLEHYEQSGKVWEDVYELWQNGVNSDGVLINNGRLIKILQEFEEFQGLSNLGKMEWLDDIKTVIAQAYSYLEVGRQLENIGVAAGTQINFKTKEGKELTGTVDSKGNVLASDGNTYNNVYQGADGNYYAGENITETNKSEKDEGKGEDKPNIGNTSKTPRAYVAMDKEYSSKAKAEKAVDDWLTTEIANITERWNRGEGGHSKSYLESRITQAKKQAAEYKQKIYPVFKTGGLANFTGPAWLDGTKSKPEYVLNAEQTKSFFTLVDVLSSLKSGLTQNTQNNGDNTYDIDINVESIGSDYDVEQLATTVKRLINEDARYRNNNAINLMR